MNWITRSANSIDVEIVLINDEKVEVLISDLLVFLGAHKKTKQARGQDEVEMLEIALKRWRKSSFKVT